MGATAIYISILMYFVEHLHRFDYLASSST